MAVARRLARLTSVSKAMFNANVLDFYKDHKRALENSGLNIKSALASKFKDFVDEDDNKKKKLEKKKTKQSKKIFYVTKYLAAPLIKEPVHVILNRFIKLCDISWLKFSVAYGRFGNLAESLEADIERKLMAGFENLHLKQGKCTCRKVCDFAGSCAKKCVIYKLVCKLCQEEIAYNGSTGRTVKTRHREHLYDVRKALRKDCKMDSFVSHMIQHFQDISEASMKVLREVVRAEIVWDVGRLYKAGSDNCELCSSERFVLLTNRFCKVRMMNANDEIFFACKHRNEFPIWKKANN